MSSMRKEIRYLLPEYWASALINGDYSDLDDCPETKVDDIPDKVKIKKMIRIKENEESYWACPECMTDAYLMSIHF